MGKSDFPPGSIGVSLLSLSLLQRTFVKVATMSTVDEIRSIVTFAFKHPLSFLYLFFQKILDLIFSPAPPPPSGHLRRPRIAVIGAGLTGVSSAAHCVGHGFDVKIFEAKPKEKGLGGIWSVSLLEIYC
jgi:hypothetical protein